MDLKDQEVWEFKACDRSGCSLTEWYLRGTRSECLAKQKEFDRAHPHWMNCRGEIYFVGKVDTPTQANKI